MTHNKQSENKLDNTPFEKNEVDLDDAMDIVGLGWYNIKYWLLLAMFLISSIVEVIGYSYILPSAKCDLQMHYSQRGLIGSMPYIAVVITSFPWGYLVDTRGRRPMIILSAFGVAIFGVLAAFMPNLSLYVLFKLIASLCLACSAAAPFAFIGEILPRKYRDIALSVTNALQALGATLVPLLAWAILPLDFKIDFGVYFFRPWRVLAIIYSSFFFICGLLMWFGPESPKYLVAQGRHDEALKVLEKMYNGNQKNKYGKFPVTKLKIDDSKEHRKNISFIASITSQTLPLLTPPYFKWIALNGFLLFGIFCTLNGLFMWVPDVLNRVFTGSVEGMTACEVIGQRFNETISKNITNMMTCNDKIDKITFKINSISNFATAIVVLGASGILKLIGKKKLLILMFFMMGTFCISINFARNPYVFATLLSTVQLPALGIGPINAYAVQMFPTELRGMAVGLGLLFGRLGSVIGTNVAGILINSECAATFYLFGGLLLLCGSHSFLLPKS